MSAWPKQPRGTRRSHDHERTWDEIAAPASVPGRVNGSGQTFGVGSVDAVVAGVLRSISGAHAQLRERFLPMLEAAAQQGTALSPMVVIDARAALTRAEQGLEQARSVGAGTSPAIAERLSEASARHTALHGDVQALLALQDDLATPAARDAALADDVGARKIALEAAWRAEAAAISPRLGLDEVIMRCDDEARALTDAEGARGVALRDVIYLNPDRVRPGTSEGREVLAHELVHLAQARLTPTAGEDINRASAEHEADDLAVRLASGGAVQAPAQAIDLARPAADRHARNAGPDRLVGHLLAAIDTSSRSGLDSLERNDDPDSAALAARRAGERIDYLVNAAIGFGAAPTKGHAADAALAFGRAAQLAAELGDGSPEGAELIGAIERADLVLVPVTKWTWKTHGLRGKRVGGGLTRKEGVAMIEATLAQIATRAREVGPAADAGLVTSVIGSIETDLEGIIRELAGVEADAKAGLVDRVVQTSRSIATVETRAYDRGIGMHPRLEQLRAHERQLRKEVGLTNERPVFENAAPTLQAIIDVLDGKEWGKPNPGARHAEVPARYRDLIDEWYALKYDRVSIRGPILNQRLDEALARVHALIRVVQRDGVADQVAPWFAHFHERVAGLRQDAATDTVSDHLDQRVAEAKQRGGTPIDQLDEEAQLKVASTKLVSYTRQATSIAQRLASASKNRADEALNAFKDAIANVDGPEPLKAALARAQHLSDVVQHLSAFANGIQGVLTLSDPEARQRMLEKEFGISAAAGVTAVAKNILWVVQGCAAGFGLWVAAAHLALGYGSGAWSVMKTSAKALSNVNVVLNVLNVAHGLALVIWGDAGQKLDGAVETAWGTLGIIGRWSARLSRFTTPLSITIALGYGTVVALVDITMRGMYALTELGLKLCFDDMARRGKTIHEEAIRLAAAMDAADELAAPELAAALETQIANLRMSLRIDLRNYLARTIPHAGSRNEDPATYGALSERFSSLWSAPLDTAEDLLVTTELLLSIIVAARADAQTILIASVREEAG